ncbi:HEAT repeat domain-containing protein [Candidatus Dojkabacteria bacterium]|uniref:HEAT repeat domain-containing protein n=1 Tax=Candidatus Dojkabacteria bacterium TaxID=2099670 RepID=A0A955L9V3_9BACT|nr:HEAT repeat domain-containing protein [Candidatus Dojkabacteria bacterium]
MSYYDLSKLEREKLNKRIHDEILTDIQNNESDKILKYFSDEDTYIRKAGYLAIRDIIKNKELKVDLVIPELVKIKNNDNELVRQTVVNALGEIGIFQPDQVMAYIEEAMFDEHHKVRNAVIGTLKKIGEKQPKPVLKFARKFIHHEDPEVRRQIIHGIELHGRKNPKDILPILRELQYDDVARVRNMVVHVIGQISYKPGTLNIVLNDLQNWENKEIVIKTLADITEVHGRYEKFSEHSQEEVKKIIKSKFKF